MKPIAQVFHCPACRKNSSEDEFPLDYISSSPDPALIWQCPNCMIVFDIIISFHEIEGQRQKTQ